MQSLVLVLRLVLRLVRRLVLGRRSFLPVVPMVLASLQRLLSGCVLLLQLFVEQWLCLLALLANLFEHGLVVL